jgi:acetyl-CoA acetyltransferase
VPEAEDARPFPPHLCQLRALASAPLSHASKAAPRERGETLTHAAPPPHVRPQARRGGLRDTDAIDLLATVYRATLERTGVEPGALGDIVVGSVLGPSSQRANEARIAMFFAGIPDTVPVRTVNRQCSSGLQAIADVAAAIKAGFYTVGLAAGVETMSQHPMSWEGGVNARIGEFPQAQGCLMPMGVTSENVAEKFGVDRATQDAFAVASHRKAAAAQAAGKFKSEIVPVATKLVDPKSGAETPLVVDKDDGIRAGVTTEMLAGLKTVFKRNGTTTAGNASQVGGVRPLGVWKGLPGFWGVCGCPPRQRRVWLPPASTARAGAWAEALRPGPQHAVAAARGSGERLVASRLPSTRRPLSPPPPSPTQVTDGAAAVLLMTRREALRRRLPVLGVFRSFAAVGVDPSIMGVGPAVAIPAAVKAAGLQLDDIDVYEINEAFASQVGRRAAACGRPSMAVDHGCSCGQRPPAAPGIPPADHVAPHAPFPSPPPHLRQATYCVRELGIDEAKVNPNGGAIALGHPLGATGARCTATLLNEMRRRGRGARFGVVSMCIGSGMGAAAVFEAGDAVDCPSPRAQPVAGQTLLSRDFRG